MNLFLSYNVILVLIVSISEVSSQFLAIPIQTVVDTLDQYVKDMQDKLEEIIQSYQRSDKIMMDNLNNLDQELKAFGKSAHKANYNSTELDEWISELNNKTQAGMKKKIDAQLAYYHTMKIEAEELISDVLTSTYEFLKGYFQDINKDSYNKMKHIEKLVNGMMDAYKNEDPSSKMESYFKDKRSINIKVHYYAALRKIMSKIVEEAMSTEQKDFKDKKKFYTGIQTDVLKHVNNDLLRAGDKYQEEVFEKPYPDSEFAIHFVNLSEVYSENGLVKYQLPHYQLFHKNDLTFRVENFMSDAIRLPNEIIVENYYGKEYSNLITEIRHAEDVVEFLKLFLEYHNALSIGLILAVLLSSLVMFGLWIGFTSPREFPRQRTPPQIYSDHMAPDTFYM